MHNKQSVFLGTALMLIAGFTLFLLGLFGGYSFSPGRLKDWKWPIVNQLFVPVPKLALLASSSPEQAKIWQEALLCQGTINDTVADFDLAEQQIGLKDLKVGYFDLGQVAAERIAPFYLTPKTISLTEKEYRLNDTVLKQNCTTSGSVAECLFSYNKKTAFSFRSKAVDGNAELQLWSFRYSNKDYLIVGEGRLGNILDNTWTRYAFYYLDKKRGNIQPVISQLSQDNFTLDLQGDFWLIGRKDLIWIIDETLSDTKPRPGAVELSVINTQFQDGLKNMYSFQTICQAGDWNCPAPPQAGVLMVYDSRLYLLIQQADTYYFSPTNCQHACPLYYWGSLNRLVDLESEDLINSEAIILSAYNQQAAAYDQILNNAGADWLCPLLNRTLRQAFKEGVDRAWENFSQDYDTFSFAYPLKINESVESLKEQFQQQWDQHYSNQVKRQQLIQKQRSVARDQR